MYHTFCLPWALKLTTLINSQQQQQQVCAMSSSSLYPSSSLRNHKRQLSHRSERQLSTRSVHSDTSLDSFFTSPLNSSSPTASERRVVFDETSNIIHPLDRDFLMLPSTIHVTTTIDEDRDSDPTTSSFCGESGWYTPGELTRMRNEFSKDKETQRYINRQRLKNRFTRAFKRS
jgi:hypothetical protein